MFFSDIHTHLLFGVDDGAKKRADMFAMVDAAYSGGTRLICATPHFCPAYFGDNRKSVSEAFSELKEYCREKYPDLKLMLGNELTYCHDCISWLKSGACLTMNESRYVLVEFDIKASEDNISEGVDRLLNSGYIPIIAHAERYIRLSRGRLWVLRQNGALVQINVQSLLRRFQVGQNKRLKTMLSERLVDFVSSDSHDLVSRSPEMQTGYEFLKEKYGQEYAESLCRDNALRLLCRKNDPEANNGQQR